MAKGPSESGQYFAYPGRPVRVTLLSVTIPTTYRQVRPVIGAGGAKEVLSCCLSPSVCVAALKFTARK